MSQTEKKQSSIKIIVNKDFTFQKQDANITAVEIAIGLLTIMKLVRMLLTLWEGLDSATQDRYKTRLAEIP